MPEYDARTQNEVSDTLLKMRRDKDFRLFVMSSFITDRVTAPEVALSLLFTNDIYAKEYLLDSLEEYIYENISSFTGDV